MSPGRAVPYVVGQWVRGDSFYGRTTLIREVLEGPRNALWILGTRRLGKTSLLKQLERMTLDGARGYFPLFWDMQGSDEPEELHLGFADALLDAQERCAAAGFDDFDAAAGDLFTALNRLRRALNSKGLTLLLLCDEVEELINLNRKRPALIGKLRNAMQGRDGVRTVVSSTIRLWSLSETIGDTSPFLHGFTPPVYLRSLTCDEAEALVRQDHLPEEDRPRIDDATAAAIASRASCHPYLTQILAKRFLEVCNLETATEAVANDRMVSYFFSVDYEMLDPREQTVLHLLSGQRGATSDSVGQALGIAPASVARDLQRLADLGFTTRSPAGLYEISSFFFRRWLDDLSERDARTPPDAATEHESASTPVHPAPLGTVADRYQLLERIAEGASAIVYKAHDQLLDATVALKQFKPGYLGSSHGLDRLRKEILLARDIAHENIVRVYDVGSHRGRAFITMQWIEAPTLEKEIETRAPFPEKIVARVACKLAGALRCAHERNVLHRDVKPSNILLVAGEEPMLGDFGLARSIGDAGITGEGMFLGTPYYASPEQANAMTLDGRSDIYALGVVMFEMATGERPFEADTRQQVLELHRKAVPRQPRSVNPLLSEEIAEIIVRCLEKNPGDRFQSALELETALRRIAGATDS